MAVSRWGVVEDFPSIAPDVAPKPLPVVSQPSGSALMLSKDAPLWERILRVSVFPVSVYVGYQKSGGSVLRGVGWWLLSSFVLSTATAGLAYLVRGNAASSAYSNG